MAQALVRWLTLPQSYTRLEHAFDAMFLRTTHRAPIHLTKNAIEERSRMSTASEAAGRIGSIRVGTDLVSVAEVQASIDEFGERYLQRVYSSHELATCRSESGHLQAHRLAARFAAKESVIKALTPSGGVTLRDIEVVLDPRGRPTMEFRGCAADALGLETILSHSVSLTHDGGYGGAVYAALVVAAPSGQRHEAAR